MGNDIGEPMGIRPVGLRGSGIRRLAPFSFLLVFEGGPAVADPGVAFLESIGGRKGFIAVRILHEVPAHLWSRGIVHRHEFRFDQEWRVPRFDRGDSGAAVAVFLDGRDLQRPHLLVALVDRQFAADRLATVNLIHPSLLKYPAARGYPPPAWPPRALPAGAVFRFRVPPSLLRRRK